jgi:hypothetical protein
MLDTAALCHALFRLKGGGSATGDLTPLAANAPCGDGARFHPNPVRAPVVYFTFLQEPFGNRSNRSSMASDWGFEAPPSMLRSRLYLVSIVLALAPLDAKAAVPACA